MKYSKLSPYKLRKILTCFFEDFTATQTSVIVGVSRNTINRYYGLFREAIMRLSISESRELGEFEVDESYFGAKRVRGKRGRWAAWKTPVLGLLKREGKVFVRIVENCSREQLMPIIQGKVLEWSTIYSDGWRAYDGLILNGYDHYRIFHSANEFARGKNHVNGIEAFWSFAKRRLSKLNGIRSEKFHLHLKECEFRYNYRNKKRRSYKTSSENPAGFLKSSCLEPNIFRVGQKAFTRFPCTFGEQKYQNSPGTVLLLVTANHSDSAVRNDETKERFAADSPRNPSWASTVASQMLGRSIATFQEFTCTEINRRILDVPKPEYP